MYFRIAAMSVCTGLAVFSQGVMAQAVGLGLAQANNCVSCHRVDETEGRKRLGPDFEVIAKRYNGGAAAIPYLATRIRSGSRGSWGAVPMPAQSHVSAADAELLAAWVLSLVGDPQTGLGPTLSEQGSLESNNDYARQ
ncbi:MAG: c-type cytochrome [Pusillimonas sp.]